jgi:hypothetical protein
MSKRAKNLLHKKLQRRGRLAMQLWSGNYRNEPLALGLGGALSLRAVYVSGPLAVRL